MKAETFRWPSVITISRATWKVTGVEYAELDAGQVCDYVTRMARALEAVTDRPADPGTEKEREGGQTNVTIPITSGAC